MSRLLHILRLGGRDVVGLGVGAAILHGGQESVERLVRDVRHLLVM